MANIYASDFENDISSMKSTHVWGAGIVDIYSTDVKMYNDIDGWFDYIQTIPTKSIIYFHNLNYDVNFILSHLNKMKFKQCTANKRSGKPDISNGYSIIASGEGSFYQLTIRFDKNYVFIRDSLKLMNGKLKKIAKDLKIPEEYYKIDEPQDFYTKARPLPYTMTDEEKKYLYNDCMALAHILQHCVDMGLTNKLTAAGFALDQFKTIFMLQDNPNADESKPLFFRDKDNHYRRFFPVLESGDKEGYIYFYKYNKEIKLHKIKNKYFDKNKKEYKEEDVIKRYAPDKFGRLAYKGGFCFVNTDESVKKKHLYVYDVNSMYPAQMLGVTDANGKKHGGEFPFGKAYYFEKIIPEDNLYIVHIKAMFKVKNGHIPFIQLKGNSMFLENEYVRDSDGVQDLWLTSVDYELFHDQYNVEYEEIIDGYYFASRTDIFRDYINKFYEMKKQGKKDKNPTLTALAKICLNSLYGKFGTRPHMPNPQVFFDEDNIMHLMTSDDDISDNEGEYIPVACFVTAYARDYIVRSAQANYKHFLYSDTDSMHMDAPAKGIWIDPYELGAWDCEADDIIQGRYIRQKTYVEQHADGHWDIRACGMPEQCKDLLLDQYGDGLIDVFHKGFEIEGKLARKRVRGGVILHQTTFAIKVKK